MRGSIRKRCQCRDDQGRTITGCRKAHGSWTFTVDVGPAPDTGRRRQVTRSGYRTRDEAQAAMTAALTARAAGAWTDDQGITVGNWLDQWLEELSQRGKSPKTMANYAGQVRDVWRPHLGATRLRDLRRAHVEKVLAELGQPVSATDRPGGNRGRRISGTRSPATIEGYRRTLRAALGSAQRRGLITVNPAQGQMDSIPDLDHDRDDLTIWEPDQTARFLQHVEDDHLAALYEIAAYAGLRRGELTGLRWPDLDANHAGVTIRQTLVEVTRSQLTTAQRRCPYCSAEHTGLYFKRPKSRAGRRWIPLPAPARAALLAHRDRQSHGKDDFGPAYVDHGLVFAGPSGHPLRPSSITTAFEAHTRTCGLPPTRLHDTRHGACSLLLSGGVPIEVVQMIMGHSSPAVTRKVYAHLLRQATADQVEAATEILTRHRREQSVSRTTGSETSPERSEPHEPPASRGETAL
jgi:integrase